MKDIADFVPTRQGDRRRQGSMGHGLRQEGPSPAALHRRLALQEGNGGQWMTNGKTGRRMGHPARRHPPVGSSVSRGGDVKRARRLFIDRKNIFDWLTVRPHVAGGGMTFWRRPGPARAIAKQIFWYTAFTADMASPACGRQSRWNPKGACALASTARTGGRA